MKAKTWTWEQWLHDYTGHCAARNLPTPDEHADGAYITQLYNACLAGLTPHWCAIEMNAENTAA